MHTPNTKTATVLLAFALNACTSMKRDDHSYVSVYQHQAAPPRQVVETLTTRSTRTRHYTSDEEGAFANGQGSSSTLDSDPVNDAGSTSNLFPQSTPKTR
jgi:hypothetical protein